MYVEGGGFDFAEWQEVSVYFVLGVFAESLVQHLCELAQLVRVVAEPELTGINDKISLNIRHANFLTVRAVESNCGFKKRGIVASGTYV